uniref:Putative alpha amylase catalytic domain family found in maltase n=1 Tax=Anopheles triannulatus TaxID=58253 RepID=A0A2M4AFB4_9DIPT
MTINERTSLLPKDYQKNYIIPIPQDDENNNVSDSNNNNSTDNGVLQEYDSFALTKAELNKYIDDPWWIRMRYGCFVTCWIVCLVALAISLYIAGDAAQHGICVTRETVTNASTPVAAAVNILPPVSSSTGAAATNGDQPSSIVFALLSGQQVA